MKVSNMVSDRGNTVPNQIVIKNGDTTIFQSYNSLIAHIVNTGSSESVLLDEHYWDYSRTTLKYLALFLRNETGSNIHIKKDIEARIKSGKYKLADLNK